MLLALLILAFAGHAAAQQVVLSGRGEPDLDRRMAAALEADSLFLITSDTLIAAGDTVPGTLVVLDVRVILEGRVEGAVLAVGADLFIRPPARLGGDLISVAGGLYPSGLATVEGSVVDRPLAPYRVVRLPEGRFRIHGSGTREVFRLEGFRGLSIPTYDRVNAVSVRLGGTWFPPPFIDGTIQPAISSHVVYRSGRGRFDGGLEAALTRGRFTASMGALRSTVTNERWIRRDLTNSLGFLWDGDDHRDYYESELLYARLLANVEAGAWVIAPWVGAQRERARSLAAGEPWTLFESDSMRPNPRVDDGVVRSLLTGVDGSWAGGTTVFEAEIQLEAGRGTGPGAEGFGAYRIGTDWRMEALFGHQLGVETQLRGPLPGTRTLPARRWTFVGGSGTLRTFDLARFRGDRLMFAETRYIVPLPEPLYVPGTLTPSLEALHAIGMAWSADTNRDFEQNIGVRLRYLIMHVGVYSDPSDTVDSAEFRVGFSWPF